MAINWYFLIDIYISGQLLAKEANLHLKDVELMNLRGRFGNNVGDPSKLRNSVDDSSESPSTGDNRESVHFFLFKAIKYLL